MEDGVIFTKTEYFLTVLRECLTQGQSVRDVAFSGVSMLPLLRQGKDTVELSPLPEKLKKYDLPVYQYPSGKVVMHRIVAVKDQQYICLGDNTYSYENVLPEYCIGLVTAIRRGNRVIRTDSVGYRLYSRIWVALFPARLCLHRGSRYLRGYVKCVLRKLGWHKNSR